MSEEEFFRIQAKSEFTMGNTIIDSIIFSVGGEEMLRIGADGRFTRQGVEFARDEEVATVLRGFLYYMTRSMNREQDLLDKVWALTLLYDDNEVMRVGDILDPIRKALAR